VKKKKIKLEIKVLSGWRLPRPWGVNTISSVVSQKPSKPKVEVSHWTPKSVTAFQQNPKHAVNPKYDLEVPDGFVNAFYTQNSNDPHNPIFWQEKEDQHTDENIKSPNKKVDKQPFCFDVHDPELEMIVFKVFDTRKYRNAVGAKVYQDVNKIIGYYAITVADMRQGIRVVPLKGKLGAPLIAGDLMVEIRKGNE